MILQTIVLLLASCFGQIISFEEGIISCLETNCKDHTNPYTIDSKQIGDLTGKQFTLQFFIRTSTQIQNAFVAQVQTDSYQLYITQYSNKQIQIQNTYLRGLGLILGMDNQYGSFQTNDWLAFYITDKYIVIQDYITTQKITYYNFTFNANTKFTLFNNGTKYWQGQACCITMYLGVSYLNNYKYILYNNKKPEAQLLLNIQQEDTVQLTIFDHSEYSQIVRMGDNLTIDEFDPTIYKDYLQFSSNQFIYANDVQLNQQYTFEFRIALSTPFTSNIILLNYSQPDFNIFIYLNGTRINFEQNDINQEFILVSSLYYHFCIAVIQNLEESVNQYNINFYQFSDTGIMSTMNVIKSSSQKHLDNIYGKIQLGSQENQFSLNEYFQLYHFRFYDGFFLDITSSIDPNCSVYLNDRCIICKAGLQLSDQYSCVSTCPTDIIQTQFTPSHNQCTRQCKAKCATCSDPLKCLTCYGLRTLPPSCTCPKGYFEDYVSPNCRKYLPEQSTQTGIQLLKCDLISDWLVSIVTFNYKYTIPPQVALFLIGVSQVSFDREINLFIDKITESNFQINIKCSFTEQFYKIQWMSSLNNHLFYQENSQLLTINPATAFPQSQQTVASPQAIGDPSTQAYRLLQTNYNQYEITYQSTQIIDGTMITYPQILGWAQNQQENTFNLQIIDATDSYSLTSANQLGFVKYSTIQTDFHSVNYNQSLITSDNTIQITLQDMPKSIKLVNIFQGIQKQDNSGNFSLKQIKRNSSFLSFSSVGQFDKLFGVVLFAAVQCDSFCTFRDLLTCNLNYTQCSCNEPTYYVNATNFCDKCDQNCYECQGYATNCTSCFTFQKKTLVGGKCICLDSQYNASDTCTDCHPNCLTCDNSINCTSCKEPKTLNSTNQCECPIGFQDSYFNCQNCHPSCLNCRDQLATSCLSCANNRELIAGLCTCMIGYFEQDTNCLACNFQCLVCIDELKCTTCPTTRDLIQSRCICKDKYYENNQQECQQCPSLCQKCQSDTWCDMCLPISNLKLQDNICACDEGYYMTINNDCSICLNPCKTCLDSQTCLSCYDDRQLIGSSCICLDRTYEDENMDCKQCQQPCLNCVYTGNKCLSCDVGRYLQNEECLCNQGFFQNDKGDCQICMKFCLECINESSCTKCQINRVKEQCQCEDGYYESESECKRCTTKCLTCNSLEQCTSCKDTMQLINSDCQCLKGTYFDGYNCLSCKTQQGLLQKECDMIKICGDGIQSITEECDDGNLVNRDGCTDCKIDDGYQCQIKLLQQSFCYKCQDKCSKCQYISSRIICQQCNDGYFLQNNNCILCSQNCKHCSSLQVCTTCPIIGTIPDEDGKCPQCQAGEQLQDGICQTICGDGILGQTEVCDFGEQNGSGGCSMQCQEQKGFNCQENVCNKIPEKQIDVSYVNSTTKTQIQINYDLKASEVLCQSFQIKIDNFTQNEFNYTFTVENEQCVFQFNYQKTITEQNLIRIVIPQTLSRLLDNDPREIVIIPRKQIYYSEQQIEQSKNVKSTQDQFKIFIQFLGPLLALLGGFQYYLTILDILSWINNLYYINIQFPLNVQFIFSNSLWDDIQLFPTSSLLQFNYPTDPYYRESPPHFLEKGTDPLFINNTYQTFGLFALLIIGYFLAQMLVRTLSRKTKINIRTIKIQKFGTEQYLEQLQESHIITNTHLKIFNNIIKRCKFFGDNIFSYFIKLLSLCYLDLISAIVLQLTCFDLDQISYKMILLNYILAYSSLVLCFYMLYLTWFASNRHLILLQNKKFIQIYGTLFENIKLDDSAAILYSFINLLRKSAYIITVVYFYNKPLFQTAFSCLISFINVGFIISYSPFDSIKTLIQQGVPDFCIFLLMLVFTICAIDDRVSVLSDATRYNIGWIIISIILISILVQLFFIIQSLIRDLVEKLKSLIERIKTIL